MRFHLLVLGMLSIAIACTPPRPASVSVLQAGWYLDPVRDEILLSILNRGPAPLALEHIVMNEQDEKGWFYPDARPLRVAPGAVVVLRTDDFKRVDGTEPFRCRLPASVVVTARRGEQVDQIVASGLPATPSALPRAFTKCNGQVTR